MLTKAQKRKIAAVAFGVIFAFCAVFTTVRLIMYSEGKLYKLQEAYEAGYLTKEDLLCIAYYYNGGRAGNEVLMAEDFVPAPKDPRKLSDKTFRSIQKSYYNHRLHKPLIFSASLDHIPVRKYCGTYGGGIVVYVPYYGSCMTTGEPYFVDDYIIDEVHFYDVMPYNLVVWQKK